MNIENPKFISLNDKMKMPTVGFGTWRVSNTEAPEVVNQALDAGYRLIDTASMYNNEEGVGKGIKENSLSRNEIFLATKLWSNDHGYDSALRAMDNSLKKLQTDYIDLFHIHWPVPKQDKYVSTWKALNRLHKEGLAKSIGVCNFQISHLQRLIDETGIIPSVNQVELHPHFQQKELREFHAKHGIVTEAWSPLARSEVFTDPVILSISKKYNKTPSQIVLRWHFESGIIAIPKTSKVSRMLENLNIFDFSLTAEDLKELSKIDREDGRTGANPDTADF
ncbi:MAG: aldo/keto reductase [Rhizobacter sp.]|nr:aldo/keto reductase [Bacteriovorax sp.]